MILETKRLILRRFTTGDLDRIYELVYADPAVKNAWSGRKGTPEEIKQGFAEDHIHTQGESGFRAMVLKETDSVIGLMGFQRHAPSEGDAIGFLLSEEEPNRRVGYDPNSIDVELTYALGRPYWKKGYATEMGKAMVAYGFEELGIGRIIQGVNGKNLNSINLMRRLGFRIENCIYPGGVVGILEDCQIRIETERLILRRLQKHDIEDFMAYDSHPDLARFRSGDPYTEDQAREFIATHQGLILGTEGEWLSLAVELKAEGKMIGHVCIKVLSRSHRQGDIGWFFNPNYQRQGFATEAGKAVLQLGFATLDLHRITARCDVLNTRSLRLMERLGMRREALFKEIVFFKGVWHDQYTCAILREEWEGLSKSADNRAAGLG